MAGRLAGVGAAGAQSFLGPAPRTHADAHLCRLAGRPLSVRQPSLGGTPRPSPRGRAGPAHRRRVSPGNGATLRGSRTAGGGSRRPAPSGGVGGHRRTARAITSTAKFPVRDAAGAHRRRGRPLHRRHRTPTGGAGRPRERGPAATVLRRGLRGHRPARERRHPGRQPGRRRPLPLLRRRHEGPQRPGVRRSGFAPNGSGPDRRGRRAALRGGRPAPGRHHLSGGTAGQELHFRGPDGAGGGPARPDGAEAGGANASGIRPTPPGPVAAAAGRAGAGARPPRRKSCTTRSARS